MLPRGHRHAVLKVGSCVGDLPECVPTQGMGASLSSEGEAQPGHPGQQSLLLRDLPGVHMPAQHLQHLVLETQKAASAQRAHSASARQGAPLLARITTQDTKPSLALS